MMASPLARKIAESFHHLDGYDLLHHKRHLTDEQGWKLKPELIPYRDMANLAAERKPSLVTDFKGGVKDWDSWYKWRRLPKESPAALLMSFPLSVYHLLVNTLQVASPTSARPNERRSLTVYLLGAEVELNFIPLYVSPVCSQVIPLI